MSYEKLSLEVDELFSKFSSSELKKNKSSLGETFFKAKQSLLEPKKGVMLPSWNGFSKALDGIRPHEFSILCGPTGSGKTMLLANLTAMLVESGAKVHVAPVETGSEDFIHRLMGIYAGKEILVSRGETKEFLDTFTDRHEVFLSRKVILSNYETRVSHKQIMCDIYDSYLSDGCTVFLLDNLNFMMEVTNSRDQITEMDKVVHDLVVFCKLLPIHIFLVMHPRKTEGGRVESEFDIKGSSTAVQEASNVILWNRLKEKQFLPMDMEPQRHFMREMKFCKIRKNGRFVGQNIFYLREKNSENLREIIL